jgi:Phage protein Gp138 N-terminal domain
VTVLPSALDIQVDVIRNELADVHTCMPAEIVGVRGGKDARQFVDVLPTLQRVVIDADGLAQNEAYPVIPMVPVGYAQGGGFFVSLPLAVGDIVLLVFAERSLDAWIESARRGAQAAVVPGDVATHTLQGAIALPCGPAPRSALLTGVDASDVVIGTTSGTILQRWKADGQVSIAEGTQFVALANLVATELTRIKGDFTTLSTAISAGFAAGGTSGPGFAGGTVMDTAFKAGLGVPPGPATVPSTPASVAATKTKAT